MPPHRNQETSNCIHSPLIYFALINFMPICQLHKVKFHIKISPSCFSMLKHAQRSLNKFCIKKFSLRPEKIFFHRFVLSSVIHSCKEWRQTFSCWTNTRAPYYSIFIFTLSWRGSFELVAHARNELRQKRCAAAKCTARWRCWRTVMCSGACI